MFSCAPSDSLCASVTSPEGEARPARNRKRGTRVPVTDAADDLIDDGDAAKAQPPRMAVLPPRRMGQGRPVRVRRPHQRSASWDSDLEELDFDDEF